MRIEILSTVSGITNSFPSIANLPSLLLTVINIFHINITYKNVSLRWGITSAPSIQFFLLRTWNSEVMRLHHFFMYMIIVFISLKTFKWESIQLVFNSFITTIIKKPRDVSNSEMYFSNQCSECPVGKWSIFIHMKNSWCF